MTLATLADDLGDDLHEHVARLELLRDINDEPVDSGVESESERAAVGLALGREAIFLSDFTGADAALSGALPMFRQIGDRLGEANTLESMAQLALVEKDATRARRLFEEAGDLSEVVHNTTWARSCREAAAAIVDRPSS